jgi:hypothetical protein
LTLSKTNTFSGVSRSITSMSSENSAMVVAVMVLMGEWSKVTR